MNARRALGILGAAAIALGALAYPAAWGIDRGCGVDVLPVSAYDADRVKTERAMWALNDSPKAEVASIYGTPSGRTDRVVFADAAKVLRPPEDSHLTLFLMGPGDHPLQAQTLYYFALPATAGGILAGAALLLLARRMKGALATAAPTG